MSIATEQECMVTVNSGYKITHAQIIDEGHRLKYYIEPESKIMEKFEEIFPIVDIENVSLNDEFLQYEPETPTEKRIKENILKAKAIGMKNFRKQAMDPSFADDGETIIYCVGRKPAVGKPAQWWEKNAPNVIPKKNSRQINELEKDVSLGIAIKFLVEEEKYEVRDSWKEVLHYDTNDTKSDFNKTGRNPVGKWYDLNSTCKVVKKYRSSGYMIYGVKEGCGDKVSLEEISNIMRPINVYIFSVGEIGCDV